MIVIGLLVFALGSFVAAAATDIYLTILGRAIQGAGAISAAVMALAADLTREEHRTKTMAIIGGSIGLMFALSLVTAPALYLAIGMAGIFAVTGALALLGIPVTLLIVPREPAAHAAQRRVSNPHRSPGCCGTWSCCGSISASSCCTSPSSRCSWSSRGSSSSGAGSRSATTGRSTCRWCSPRSS
ncbi:MAG: MFS transporter [Candidatus Binatia bacterium]